MSATQAADPVASSTSKVKKKKKNKKKGAGTKEHGEEESAATNGTKADQESDGEDAEDAVTKETAETRRLSVASIAQEHEVGQGSEPVAVAALPIRNGHSKAIVDKADSSGLASDAAERLDALAKERDALKAEVTELRRSLESIQAKHEAGSETSSKELEEAQAGKEHWEKQYNQLLERVNTIRSQLGDRLKADRAELAQAQSQIEELEEQNKTFQETNENLQSDISRLTSEKEGQSKEINDLRGRANLSQQNWVKERDELISREAYAREEFETAKQAMQDWEVLAMEERALRQNLTDRVGELEEQLHGHQEAFEKASSERDMQAQAVDGLQRALRDVQEARKKELRELVENSQAQLDELRKQLQTAEDSASSSRSELAATKKELERAIPFEKEVKEKNLLIGKLRHEAVILNDHLTKALRFLKQRKPEDMVDRQLVTNHFLQFLALDRSDPKKFQILQIIAALLVWTDEQKEQAGLSRPGAVPSASSSSLRIPSMSPFRRPSSQTTLTDLESPRGGSKESLAELWSDFLEREAQEGQRSRRGSKDTLSPTGLDRKPSAGLG